MSTEPTAPPTVIVLREGLVSSILSDSFTFGVLFALPWFNYRFCGGSGWINCAIAIGWFVGLVTRTSGRMKAARKTPAQARAFLDEHYPS